MSDTGSLIPISDEQAKAIQEALKTLQGLGGFLEKTFGTVPQDLVGLLGGDWLKVRRAENIARILEKAKERLKARHVETPEPASLSIALPILVAAADESRDELQDIWARLLAAAADLNRARFFRIIFIEIAKKLDPLDASVLHEIREFAPTSDWNQIVAQKRSIAPKLGITEDQCQISILNLANLDLVISESGTALGLTSLGREFLRVIDD